MIVEINVVNVKCENCGVDVHQNNNYCYNCGHDLNEVVTYEELPKEKIISSRDYNGMH